MNTDIANILKSYIETLPFADKVGGLVKAVTFAVGDGNNWVKKIMPIDCGVTQQDCVSGKYVDLMPNTKYNSIMYFEDEGITLTQRDVRDFSFESHLKLVVWLNLKKMGKEDCSASALAVANILNVLPTAQFNSGVYNRIQIVVEGEEIKSAAIFGRYTYDEEKLQYLIYPFDYFALNISIRFTISKSCIPLWTNGEPIC